MISICKPIICSHVAITLTFQHLRNVMNLNNFHYFFNQAEAVVKVFFYYNFIGEKLHQSYTYN